MPHTNGACYEFGPYRLDAGRRVLTRNGESVALPPKVTEILILLVRRAGELIEKEELINQIWPDSFVEEANVSQNIFSLRRALGDERSGPRFIETIVKRGYRFIAPVTLVKCEPPETVANKKLFSTPPTLAVLPLVDATQDSTVEYLVDGLTDNIINSLSSVSKVRVMSRSAVMRYEKVDVDPQKVGRELGVDAILVGRITSSRSGHVISVELVDVTNGWQLWGESFDCTQRDMLEIQNQILIQLSAKLRLKLTGEEKQRITARYTENGDAYQSYLEGRFHWSKYTREGIERAITCFREAIELDPNYVLAYAGIIDCYLRLATNYLPPEESSQDTPSYEYFDKRSSTGELLDPRIRLRQEWDWRGAERELRRASDLKTPNVSPHQWHAAYLFIRQLYQESEFYKAGVDHSDLFGPGDLKTIATPSQMVVSDLTRSEEVQILCAIAREQIAVGNFVAADLVLKAHRVDHGWANLGGLSSQGAGDLLFTLGSLIGNLAGSGRIKKGHRQGEALLNGAIATFEQLSMGNRAGEARLELARCYYREGLFELAADQLSTALKIIEQSEHDLRSSCLCVFGAIDRDSGRLDESMRKLTEASTLSTESPLTKFRFYFEMATTLKRMAITDQNEEYAEDAVPFFYKSLQECDAIGNHLYGAAVRNNLGFFLVSRSRFSEAKFHLLSSRRVFEVLGDEVRAAVVNESLSQLYIVQKDYQNARTAIEAAVQVLELNDAEPMLAEALTTKGLIAIKLNQSAEAIKILQGAQKVAERCAFSEGVASIFLIICENLSEEISESERETLFQSLERFSLDNASSPLCPRIRQLAR